MIAATQLVDHVMAAGTVESAETQHARLGETRRQHGPLAAEDRVRGRGAADHALFVDDASVILTVYAGGTREDEGLRADFAGPGERALHADIIGQRVGFRSAAAGARGVDDGVELLRQQSPLAGVKIEGFRGDALSAQLVA